MPKHEALDVAASVPGTLVVVSPQLFISVVDGDSSLEGTRAQSACARSFAEKPRGSIGCLVVLGQKASPPPPELRKEITLRLWELAPFAAGFAIVIEADGFRGSTLRAIFTSFLMLQRLPYKAEVFRSSREALMWLASLTKFDATTAGDELMRLRIQHGMAP